MAGYLLRRLLLVLPTLLGTLAIVLCALLYLNAVRQTPYPQRW